MVERSDHRWATSLAWSAVLLDGFDLVVLGTVLPVLLDGEVWGLNAASASVVSTFGLIGMTIGALTIGALTDIIGRRKALMLAVASLRQTIRAVGMREDRRLSHAEIKRLLLGNPMRKPQLLLGYGQESNAAAWATASSRSSRGVRCGRAAVVVVPGSRRASRSRCLRRRPAAVPACRCRTADRSFSGLVFCPI